MTTVGSVVFGQNFQQNFGKYSIGYDQIDRVFKSLSEQTNKYPPYNIKKINEDQYMVEVAVAGFDQSEISVEVKEQILTIKGNTKNSSEEYIHQGIARRNFTRELVLNEFVEVTTANLVNGMLQINLAYIVPEHKKPKVIPIGSKPTQLLTE